MNATHLEEARLREERKRNLKVARRIQRKLDRQMAYDKFARPFRLLWQTIGMATACLFRKEFARSFNLDHRIMIAGDRAACERYEAWVVRFRNLAHKRSL